MVRCTAASHVWVVVDAAAWRLRVNVERGAALCRASKASMYKFVVIQGSCGNPYEVAKAEQSANSMVQQGYVMDHVYQTTTRGCWGASSSLVMVFRPRG